MHYEDHLLTRGWNMKTGRHREPGQSGVAATGMKLQTVLPKCPICGESTKGHFFGQVASTPVSEKQKPLLAQFFGFVRQHEWSQLISFKEWNSGSDNLVAYAIQGDHPNGALVVLKDVFELYEGDEIVLQETLSAGEMETISSAAAVKWHPM